MLFTLVAALVLLAVAWFFGQELLVRLFGPPRVTLVETYEERPDGPVFDHSLLTTILGEHVDAEGRVDYGELAADPVRLDLYLKQLEGARPDDLGRSERLALLINAYNAFTLRLIVDHWDGGALKSIKDIPEDQRWEAVRWKIGAGLHSLSDIEHRLIRPHFAEARIHFALVCAALGCPPLRNEAYTGARLEEQLRSQSLRVHGDARWLRHEANSEQIELTLLYSWYGNDFEQVAESVIEHAARFSAPLATTLKGGGAPAITWLPYDWALNRQ